MPTTAPLRWEQSAESTHPTVSDHLPNEVVTCLRNARFLHLATCTENVPHVSLMNYTYLPSHPFPPSSSGQLPSGPTIIMTTNPSSKKTRNLLSNPNVSLLVHDWVSSRPPTNLSGSDRERSPAGGPRSSLAAMLMQMNSTAVSSNSITINGEAVVLESGSDEEKWCKEQHVANNTFEDTNSGPLGGGRSQDVFGQGEDGNGDSGKGAYIEGEDVRVVLVRIKDGRISDWKGNVSDWAISQDTETARAAQAAPVVNGT
ncbi:Putative pyridoxamine 5'-phosphate oxidase, FMN-binding split barrel [Septoria linicola]|uniref:Pyridoxamine 5'-phosphate oxidase, FMN-binding split barrel n=1 Tax=Septoria linicola TaxID=215465 RepID=A0A9Q9EI43_9PEZI|nr:Putative pyridoxamine 5'-phosphate oxidase, FMN-binding split barrel [Septoria linicola]